MKKNDNNELFMKYAIILKNYDPEIDIRRKDSSDIVKYNGIEHKINTENEYIELLKNIIVFKVPKNKNELFVTCTDLFKFISKNNNDKKILNLILPDNQSFKTMFSIAIHIENSPKIFDEVTEKQFSKINFSNINIILGNFIVNHNTKELSNIELLEKQLQELEDKLESVKEKIEELTSEKDKKNKDMEEKTATMKFYVEFKQLASNIKVVDNEIRELDGKKLEKDINNIKMVEELDELKLLNQSLSSNFIKRFINRKSINENSEKINSIRTDIKTNNSEAMEYKSGTKKLNERKKELISTFCNNYNSTIELEDEFLFTFDDIKKQFEKIRKYQAFTSERKLMNLVEQQTLLSTEIGEIKKNTKYKNKFYLLYQIKTACNVLNIPIEEVIVNEELIKIVDSKKVVRVA